MLAIAGYDVKTTIMSQCAPRLYGLRSQQVKPTLHMQAPSESVQQRRIWVDSRT